MGSVGSLDRFQLACPPTVADEAARRAVQVYQAGAAADPEKTATYLTIAAQRPGRMRRMRKRWRTGDRSGSLQGPNEM